MKNHKLYPIRLYAHDNGHYVSSPQLAKLIWDRLRKNTTWYATDCEILSPELVKIFVYNMESMVSGGIGECILTETHPISKFGAEAKKLLQESILETQTKIARQEFIRREEAERQQQILEIRKELFGV